MILIASILASLNLAYGNCDTNGEHFSYAPDSLVVRNVWTYKTNLTSNDYANANWWKVIDNPPVVTSNQLANAYGWRKNAFDNTREQIDWIDSGKTNEQGEVIWIPVTNIVHFTTYNCERLYNVVIKPIPRPNPVYSVADLFFWVKTKGKTAEVDAALEQAGWYTVAVTTQQVEGDNEIFRGVIQAVKDSGLFTQAEIDEALAYALVGGEE